MSLLTSLPAASGGTSHGLVAASTTSGTEGAIVSLFLIAGLRVKMCVWLGVSRGLDLAFLNAD